MRDEARRESRQIQRRKNSGNESASSKGDVRALRTEEQRRWEQMGATQEGENGEEGRSESRLTPEEIQRAVADIDQETMLRTEACSEETRVEKEVKE